MGFGILRAPKEPLKVFEQQWPDPTCSLLNSFWLLKSLPRCGKRRVRKDIESELVGDTSKCGISGWAGPIHRASDRGLGIAKTGHLEDLELGGQRSWSLHTLSQTAPFRVLVV